MADKHEIEQHNLLYDEISLALHALTCRSSKTYFVAIHPDGSCCLIHGDMFGKKKSYGHWHNKNTILEAIADIP